MATNRTPIRHAQTGFTLVEVMVALAVVAIGLTGVFTTINGMINSAAYLRDKTLANWVAQNHITELRLQDKWPDIGKSTDDIEMAGQEWRISTEVIATPVEKLRRLDVAVSYKETPDDFLVNVAGFVGEPPGPLQQRGWRAGAITPPNSQPGPGNNSDDKSKPDDGDESENGGT